MKKLSIALCSAVVLSSVALVACKKSANNTATTAQPAHAKSTAAQPAAAGKTSAKKAGAKTPATTHDNASKS